MKISTNNLTKFVARLLVVTTLLYLAGCAEKDYFDELEGSHWLGGEPQTESWCMTFGYEQLLELVTYDKTDNQVSYNYGLYNAMRGKKIRTLTRLVDKKAYDAAIENWTLEAWDAGEFAQEFSWVVTEFSDDRLVWVSKGLLRQGNGRVSGENEFRTEYKKTDSCQRFIEAIPDGVEVLLPIRKTLR